MARTRPCPCPVRREGVPPGDDGPVPFLSPWRALGLIPACGRPGGAAGAGLSASRGGTARPPAQLWAFLRRSSCSPASSSVGGSPCLCPPLGSCGAWGGSFSRGRGAVQCAPMCFLIRIFPETSEAERLFPRVFDIGVCFLGENVPSSPLPVCFSWLSF